MNIVWSDQARTDLRAIRDFIGRDSEYYAVRTVARLIERVGIAAQMPSAGHRVHEYPELLLREVHEARYRVIYRSRKRTFEVVTIVHFKEKLTSKRVGMR